MKGDKQVKFSFDSILAALSIVLIILYGVNIFLTAGMLGPLKTEAEKNRAANLELRIIASDCAACNAMGGALPYIKSQNVKITSEKNLSSSDSEAQSLMSRHGIVALPAVIVTGEISKVAELWKNMGVSPADGAVVISKIPPYYDTQEKAIKGSVEVIILGGDCAGCYDPLTHMAILKRFGAFVGNTVEYNVSSGIGENLVDKYNITKVPTILLSPDASLYPALNQVWPTVGTVESDGWYVFRTVEIMGTYKDLVNNTTVNATAG